MVLPSLIFNAKNIDDSNMKLSRECTTKMLSIPQQKHDILKCNKNKDELYVNGESGMRSEAKGKGL
jgi:hypothetical protein